MPRRGRCPTDPHPSEIVEARPGGLASSALRPEDGGAAMRRARMRSAPIAEHASVKAKTRAAARSGAEAYS